MNKAKTSAAGPDIRLIALRRFAIAITLLNVLGHTVLGFEQSLAQPLVALLTTYSMELLLEWMAARREGRVARYRGGVSNFVHFLLSAHITGLAVAMLLYANERLFPIAFAAAVAMGSKVIFRFSMGGRPRHFLNPSNFGITMTLLCLPWVGIAPPYMFTENLYGVADWILPAVIILSGSYLNARLTRKMPLIGAWLGGFVLQAVLRHLIFDTPLAAALNPMTGVAFLLFTFYMVTDPATTPFKKSGQVAFGLSVAAAYGVLMMTHIVFGLFFALTAVCVLRGGYLFLAELARRREPAAAAVPATVIGGSQP